MLRAEPAERISGIFPFFAEQHERNALLAILCVCGVSLSPSHVPAGMATSHTAMATHEQAGFQEGAVVRVKCRNFVFVLELTRIRFPPFTHIRSEPTWMWNFMSVRISMW